jgi:hypothetical protein
MALKKQFPAIILFRMQNRIAVTHTHSHTHTHIHTHKHTHTHTHMLKTYTPFPLFVPRGDRVRESVRASENEGGRAKGVRASD